jgi:tRNA uridine 5-carboxymethylaminomethyl modification enzyme
MFTSRAEHRLLLREDNADLRLSEMGHRLGLLSDENFALFEKRRNEIEHWRQELGRFHFLPTEAVNGWLTNKGMSPLKDRVSGEAFLRRPEIDWTSLCELGLPAKDVVRDVQEQVEIQVKYEGYIKRDLELQEGIRKNEMLKIPSALNFDEIAGLSNEIKGRLKHTRPETIGQASRMSGITPAAVATLMIYLKMSAQKEQRSHV